MSHQVVLITGALTGIGRAAAVAFARKGAKIVVSGRHDDKGQALATELRALGTEAEFVRADVQKEDDVRTLVDKTIAKFGRLDVAVNNAGFDGQLGPIQDATVENFKAVHVGNLIDLSGACTCPVRRTHMPSRWTVDALARGGRLKAHREVP